MNRRTVLAGTAAVLASPLLTALPALADAKRQSLVDQSLRSATKVLSGKDYPDALRNMTKARGVIIVPELVQALDGYAAPVVFVSNEVGLGIVPETPLGRAFRDAQGRLNMRMAGRADRVILMAAGLPLIMKDRPAPRG